ncbi:uncharacterized protein LOC127255796 isoform X2 [Andrographis paniculata]|uniref:uncharacterized protein LOC127255796 isoform X2 n=1 Tax=Andrographis paniculata TaxID=175694 RepID=UPI0021E7E6CD|nr:uncharacterized protein LOC127255796 isoform X2 [Andrographis paniculata]
MASNRLSKSKINPCSSSSSLNIGATFAGIDDADDFQDFPSSCFSSSCRTIPLPTPLKPHKSSTVRPSKKLKKGKPVNPGKENCYFDVAEADSRVCGLDSIEPTLVLLYTERLSDDLLSDNSEGLKLLNSSREAEENVCDEEFYEEGSTELDELLKLCAEVDEPSNGNSKPDTEGKFAVMVSCPLCGADISGLSDDMRQIHTNECLDKGEDRKDGNAGDDRTAPYQCPGQVVDGSPVKSNLEVATVSPLVEWLKKLGLAKYEEIFVREEIDWEALQCLTEEDLYNIGITALGPRKKILHALKELENSTTMIVEPKTEGSKGSADNSRVGANKLITDYFSDPTSRRKRDGNTTSIQNNVTNKPISTAKKVERKDVRKGKQKNVPVWCCIPGTPFRVDAFKYLRRDCSHWFLTHFHLDHYQGLTRSFCHGMIYCSAITAKLVNLKIGIPRDKIQVLPLNQKINIAGIDVTCFDANHCPGAIIILFELPSGKHVLHTGDFRFCKEMKNLSMLQTHPIHTLILDTTYCNPQYDFPEQDSVIQFVIDAIQAEAFNPKTLFLIGSYTIGKERLFVEVATALRKKIYVTAAKLRILECLGLPQEHMQWFTLNEQESHIHVVPMWSIANFKRLKHMSNHYMGRFNLIVAFSPTGWSMGKGKKSTGRGRRWQQGTIISSNSCYSTFIH